MKLRFGLLCFLMALASALALAADISGKWTAEMQGRGGQTMTTTCEFKVDGDKLTGTVTGGRGGPVEISDGKISGDDISFAVVREFGGNSIKQMYTGKVSGDEIKFKVEVEGREGSGREFTAKKAQ